MKKYQQELNLPAAKLLQEVTTRWWSILAMLESILKNRNSTTLALSNAKKFNLILTEPEIARIKEIIELLDFFKKATDQCGVENDISITLILPTFHLLKKKLSEVTEENQLC